MEIIVGLVVGVAAIWGVCLYDEWHFQRKQERRRALERRKGKQWQIDWEKDNPHSGGLEND